MYKQDKQFYLSGKKIVKMVNEKNNVPIYFCHSLNGDVRLRANISCGFKPEYSMLLHLYEHLMFHNVVVDDMVFPGISELMGYADKHNISLNARTGSNGIEVLVDIRNVFKGNNRFSKIEGKPTKRIEWLDHMEAEDNVLIGLKILNGILYNRKMLTDDDIIREIGVVSSEMDTNNTKIKTTFNKSQKTIIDGIGPVLGKSDDFKRIGTDKVIEIMKWFDKNVASSDIVSFNIYYDMEKYGDPSVSETAFPSRVLKYLDFIYADKNPDRLVGKPLDDSVLRYKVISDLQYKGYEKLLELKNSGIEKEDDMLKAMIFSMDFKLPNNDMSFIDGIEETVAYHKFIQLCLWDIGYGIFNFIREVKQSAYSCANLDFSSMLRNLGSYMKINKSLRRFALPLNMVVFLNDNTDVDSLEKDVLEYMENLKLTEERFETIKNIILAEYASIDITENYLSDIKLFEEICDYIKYIHPEYSDEYVLGRVSEMYIYNINRYDYNWCCNILKEVMNNISIIKIK